jgi:hypothetical protein
VNFHSWYSCNISKLPIVFKLLFICHPRVCPQLVTPFYPAPNPALSFTFLLLLIAKSTYTTAASFAFRKRAMSNQWLNNSEIPHFILTCSQSADTTVAMLLFYN